MDIRQRLLGLDPANVLTIDAATFDEIAFLFFKECYFSIIDVTKLV